MTKYDVGILKIRDCVRVEGQEGVVVDVHEPEWIDHRTRAFRKEFAGADIRFKDEEFTVYIPAKNIEKVGL